MSSTDEKLDIVVFRRAESPPADAGVCEWTIRSMPRVPRHLNRVWEAAAGLPWHELIVCVLAM